MSKWKKVTPNQATKWVNPFGTRLRDQIPSQLSIPPFVQAAFDFIVANGLKEEGIFRISANLSSVNKMKEKISTGAKTSFKKPEDDPYDVACLLKLYFRELIDPVCTFEFYDCFIASQGIPEEYRLAALIKVVGLLPLPNQLLLMKLVEFCEKIVEYKDINKMGFDNLAVCFAPNLIRAKSVSVELVLSDASRANSAIRLMFGNGNIVFQRTRLRLERMQIGNKEEKQKAEEQRRRSRIEEREEVEYQQKEEENIYYQQYDMNQENSNGTFSYSIENSEMQQYPQEIPAIGPFEGDIPPVDNYSIADVPTIEASNTEEEYETPKAEYNANDAQEESPSMILASVDPRLVSLLSAAQATLNDPRASSEEDSSNAEFASTLKNRYTMFVKNNLKKMKKDKTRSMALGQLDAYEQQLTSEYCQVVVGVNPKDLKEGTWESNEYNKLYNKTIANLKNFSSADNVA